MDSQHTAGRTRPGVRRVSEILAEVVGAGESGAVVIVLVPGGSYPAVAEGIHRTESRHRVRPAGLSSAPEDPVADSGWACLTDRERAVALLAGHALTNQQIARRLRISPHTVNFHLRQVFKKLSIESRVSLARFIQARPPADPGRGGQPAGGARPELSDGGLRP